MRNIIRFLLAALLAVFTMSSSVRAQSSTATLTGVVTDSQSLPIPDVTVAATNTATGIKSTTKTTSSGNYTIPNLPPGIYDVKFEAVGKDLAAGEAKGVKLNIGDNRDLPATLAPKGTAITVEVTSEAPLIESTKTDVSNTVTDLDMERLPTFAGTIVAGGGANDYANLALISPGVKMDTSTISGDLIGPGSMNNRANLYNVDGSNITNNLVSGRDSLGASVDEVQEFQVLTNNYNAEYGQAGGLVLNVRTKSGSNDVHGDGHAFFRGRNLTAAQPFYNLGLVSSAVPAGTVGPLGSPHCPTSDFSAGSLTSVDGCDRAPFNRHEGGFTIGGPFIKDKLFWFGSYELSHQSFPTILTPDIGNVLVPTPTKDLLYSGKIDYKISQKHTLSGRYAIERIFQDNVIVQTSNSVTPDDLTTLSTHAADINVGLVSSLTPTLVNEARVVVHRFLLDGPADKTTLPGVIHADGTISGADFCCPQGQKQRRYQYIDNLTWSQGAHTFKTGFNISYLPWFSLFQQFHNGQYTLNAAGAPTSFTFGSGPGAVTSKDNIYGFYLQDTWKLTRKLTMNAGVRYDVEAGAFKGGTIPRPGGGCFQGNGSIPACSSDYNNWQPRLGFTFAPRNNWLVKASAGVVTMLAFNNVVLDSLNFDGKNLRTVTTTNPAVLAAFPNYPNPALLVGPACPPNCGRIRPISPNLHNPTIYMYNFAIQHELTNTLSIEADYIGQFGFGLFGERDVNAPPTIPDPAHPGFFYFGSRPNPIFTAVRTNENSRTSHYNGLLLSVTKRFSNHVQFLASYTWSHALTSGEDFFGLSEPGDYVHIRPELGPAFNDIRHAANLGVVLDSGKVTDMKIARPFTNDLSLSFVGQFQSGRPYPFSTGTAGFGGSGRFFGTGSETQQRPNVLANGTISTAGIAAFDGANALIGPNGVAACTAAGFSTSQCNAIQNTFSPPTGVTFTGAVDSITGDPVDFQFVNGNMGRNAGRSSPFNRLDISLKKTLKIPRAERLSVELRADAFNVFNHSNWQTFNGNNITSLLTFGKLNPTAPAGTGFFDCVLCMRPNGTLIGSNGQALTLNNIQNGKFDSNLLKPIFGGIGDPSTTEIPRTLQLSFHVRF